MLLSRVELSAEECDNCVWLRTQIVGEVFLLRTKYVLSIIIMIMILDKDSLDKA